MCACACARVWVLVCAHPLCQYACVFVVCRHSAAGLADTDNWAMATRRYRPSRTLCASACGAAAPRHRPQSEGNPPSMDDRCTSSCIVAIVLTSHCHRQHRYPHRYRHRPSSIVPPQDSSAPKPIALLSEVTFIDAGAFFSGALTRHDELRLWGQGWCGTPLSVVHCMWPAAWCLLHIVCCMVSVACCLLHVVCCLLSVARCTLCRKSLS